MKEHYLSRGFNLIVLSLALLMLIYSYIQLFHKGFTPSIGSEMPLIGTVTDHNNTVKLKKAHLFSWLDVSDTKKVNAEDLIFTYKESTSVVLLGEDKTINIYPETMIQLKSSDQLDLKKGRAEFSFKQKNSKLTIFLGNKKVTVKADNAKVVISQNKDQGSIQVESGVISVQTQNEVYEVKANNKLTVANDDFQVTQINLEPQSPVNQVIRVEAPTTDIPFVYQAPSGRTVIEVGQEKSFSKPLERMEVSTENPYLNLKHGHYFWRISQADNYSEAANFTIIYMAPGLTDLAPANNYELVSYEKEVVVELDWSRNNHYENFHLEIYDLNDNRVLSEILEEKTFQWKTEQAGDYTWRVRAFGDTVDGHWSDKQKFTILHQEYREEKPMVIELSRPNQKVTFNWDHAPEDKENIFTLSRDENFKSIVREVKVRSNSTSVVFPTVGKFYWKVSNYDEGKKVKPKTVIIKPTPPPEKPKPLPPLKLKLKSTKKTSFNLLNWLIPSAHAQNAGFVDLTWPAIDDADFYEIEIFTDKKLRNKILTVPSRDNTHRWNVLRAGKFYWRYRYRDYWGRFSPYSDPSELEISPATISPQKPVVAKKSAPVKPQTSTSIVKTPTLETFNYWLGLTLSPSQVDFDQISDDRYQIKGTALGSYQLKIGSKFHSDHNFSAEYSVMAGKVFDTENFLNRNAMGAYHYTLWPVVINAGTSFNQISSYQTQDDKAKFDQMLSSYSAFLGASYKLGFIPLTFIGNYHVGSYQGLHLKLSYLTSLWERYQFELAGALINSNVETDDTQIDLSASKLDMALRYLF